MTQTLVRRTSLLRALWAATMPEALAFLMPCLGLFLFQTWLAWHHHNWTLNSLAFGYRFPVIFLGTILLMLAWMPDGEGRPKWARRLSKGWEARWQSVTRLDLTPVAASGSGPSVPGAIAVAQPVLAGLGAACLGFGLGLTTILVFSHDQIFRDTRVEAVAFCFLIVFTVAVAIYRVSGSARRLYIWSQAVAAAAATAEADADRARISALQAQMNPHFLFNALNTVASLLGSDGVRAQHTVQNLSGMLKHTLQRSAQPLTTVEEELQFVRDYLDIERERFGSRLQVTYSIDPETAAMAVPTMSLQPLVENAIKHAVTNRLEGGHIRIAAWKRAEAPMLRLSVEDDGPGFAPGSEDGTGLGNLRARLRSLYGPGAELLTETLPTGARVSLTIPLARP